MSASSRGLSTAAVIHGLVGGMAIGCAAGSARADVRTVPLPAGVTLDAGYIYEMRINDRGDIAGIHVSLNGAGDTTLLAGRASSLRILARTGLPVPGIADPIRILDNLNQNNRGDLALSELTFGPVGSGMTAVVQSSVLAWCDGAFTSVARLGAPVPGNANLPMGTRFGEIATALGMSDQRQVTFAAKLLDVDTGSIFNNSVWQGAVGSPTLIARTGAPTPAAVPGASWFYISAQPPSRDGALTINGYLSGADVTLANDITVWLFDGGEARLMARTGDPVPGRPGHVYADVYSWQGSPRGGLAAFGGRMAPAGMPRIGDGATFYGAPGAMLPVVERTTPVPGAPHDYFFSTYPIGIDRLGRLVFSAQVAREPLYTYPRLQSIWRVAQSGAALEPVLHPGQLIPGLQSGLVEWIYASIGPEGRMVCNLEIRSSNEGYTTFRRGLAAEGRDGTIRMVVDEGSELLIDGVPRTVRAFGAYSPVNARGQMLAEVRLETYERQLLLIDLDELCPADWNADGRHDPDDLADFIAGYFAPDPDPRTEVSGDGVIDPDDLADFVATYFGGCP